MPRGMESANDFEVRLARHHPLPGARRPFRSARSAYVLSKTYHGVIDRSVV